MLITDDDEGCRDLFEHWLAADHEVLTAPDGETALSTLSAEVDVVLLDREMPGPSGIDVAREIAASRHDPYLVMVSSKPVETDIVDVPFDAYIRKPAVEADFREAIEEYRARREYETALDELFALTAKLAAIEADNSREELVADEGYQRLRWLVEEKRAEVDYALDRSRTDWSTAFRSFGVEASGEAPCKRV